MDKVEEARSEGTHLVGVRVEKADQAPELCGGTTVRSGRMNGGWAGLSTARQCVMWRLWRHWARLRLNLTQAARPLRYRQFIDLLRVLVGTFRYHS
jgi:hypothetical protein